MSAPDNKITTPCLLLDVRKMQRNIERMDTRIRGLGAAIRPHVKTCKAIEPARRMVREANPGITVSTLAEAEYFFRHGFTDQIYAVGIAPGKLDRVAGLIDAGLTLRITIDHASTSGHVCGRAMRLGCSFPVMLEIDADGERGGFAPDDPALTLLAQTLERSGCTIAGVLTHMGASYHCRDRACLVEAAERERCAVVEAAEALRRAGFECPIVSAGSTPTARFVENLEGVTEMRVGTHVFMDLVMAGLGVCELDDIAISVLCEVIGHREHSGEFLVDAGWMALSRDRGTADQEIDQGYGVVCDEKGKPI
ncbi:MAG: alanine racemase, partial [Wenzhouxiangellaceae bacterium]